ncbi:MAG: 23S rRNA (guanosine(2251)-2'-O)-methyltransferase RlmB [Gammaproteobacteria bacterium]
MHAVTALLRKEPELVKRLWLEQSRRDQRGRELLGMARSHGITVERVDRQALDQQVGEVKHQGVVAESQNQPAMDEASFLDWLEQSEVVPFLLILDGVQDPHNLGACLRTADAVGVQAVIAPRDNACGLTATVRKVACGGAETVPFVQVTNLARVLRQLQERGVFLIGTAAEAEVTLYQADLRGPIGLVLGAEGKGMRRLTREHCDTLVSLPMVGQVESLNVSVSAGVLLYEALRQRGI